MTTTAKRASGVFLHVTSLPSAFGIGDLGPESYKFADRLVSLKQQFWSVLPLNPTSPTEGNSPYKTDSAFAANPLLISPEKLSEEGLITKPQMENARLKATNKVDFVAAEKTKTALLNHAFQAFCKSKNKALTGAADFEQFQLEMSGWLNDYALYKALASKSGEPWYLWPGPLRNREPQALVRHAESLKEQVEQEKFVQYTFFSQWQALKEYCNKRGVKIFGDLAFYVSLESADVWAHPDLFKLNKQLMPQFIAGVPPDYFSKTGQLWGTPIYKWRRLAETQFEWWISRLEHNLKFCDVLRFDHFRGFVAYWQVPAHAKTAKTGRWIRAPTKTFFNKVKEHFPTLPFIAEDLGYITKPVHKVISWLGLPGMRVLLFAFGGSAANPHRPENHVSNAVVYTGTHDTNTVRGWFTQEADAKAKRKVFAEVGREVSETQVSFEFVKMALSSKARLSIVPLQDVLGLGSEARMNFPARQSGNWLWRVTAEQLASEKLNEFGQAAKQANRG
ncbi:MAG: 4-alpha-glucanotransferase [Candidatus Bathyarchaeia archaeon]|jgi:4-alpha-glucanotransferase